MSSGVLRVWCGFKGLVFWGPRFRAGQMTLVCRGRPPGKSSNEPQYHRKTHLVFGGVGNMILPFEHPEY